MSGHLPVLFLLTVASVTPALIAQGTSELAMRSGVAEFLNLTVQYSQDERYAAVAANTQVYVYNLSTAAEVLRLKAMNPFFVANLGMTAFDSETRRFYMARGSALVQCSLDREENECRDLRTDLLGSFALGPGNRIGYVDIDNIPTIIDVNSPATPVKLTETVPVNDREAFSWLKVSFIQAPAQRPQLLLIGSIDRDTKQTGPGGRVRTVSRSEWRVSAFDVETRAVRVSYKSVPVDVSSAALTGDGRTILCGQDSGESKSAEDDYTRPPRFRLFDLNATRYLQGSELLRVPVKFRNDCTAFGGPESLVVVKQGNGKPGSGQVGWKSPSGRFTILPETGARGNQILTLKETSDVPSSKLLAGSVQPLVRVRFVRTGLVSANGFFEHHLYDFLTGTVSAFPMDTSYAAGIRGAFFLQPDPAKPWLLAFLGADGRYSAGGLTLAAKPKWFELSSDGNVVAYETRSELALFSGGSTTKLSCDTGFGWDDLRRPVLNPQAKLLGAFCRRDKNAPTESGLDTFFVIWDLATGKEATRILAAGFDKSGAISWDGLTVALVGRSGLRIAAIAPTGNTINSFKPFLPETETVDAVVLGGEPPLAIVASHDLSNNGRLAWIDFQAKRRVDQIVAPGWIKDIATDRYGNLAVLRDDNIVSVHAYSRKRIARLVTVGGGDWLAFSEQGMFDGTAGGLQWAGFRRTPSSTLVTANLFFNELYAPGLLAQVVGNSPPTPPPGISLSTFLEVPGLKSLLQNGDLVPVLRNDKVALCVVRRELATTLQERRVRVEEDTDPQCPRRVVPSQQSDPRQLLTGMRALAESRPVTPWDKQHINGPAATVYVLSVAVGAYGEGKLQAIPSAVPATESLHRILKTRAAGTRIVDWGPTQCGGQMFNERATKAVLHACLTKLAETATPEDMVILTLTGHGGTSGESELFNFYPYDATAGAGGLNSAELADILRKLRARRLVLIVDACESGATLGPLEQMAGAKASVAARLALIKAANPPNPEQQAEGVLLIAAASGLEPATGTNLGNPFLERLAAALTSVSRSPITAHSLAADLKKPIEFKSGSGSLIRVQPFTAAIGADFTVAANEKR